MGAAKIARTGSSGVMDILLTHGYFLTEDEHEKRIFKPYPPLGILSLSAYLKSRGFDVGVYDSTFSTRAKFRDYLESARPPIVGIYCNLMTKFAVLEMIAMCRQVGARVVLGGPEPAPNAAEYLDSGADVIVVGEGELTLEEVIRAFNQGRPPQLYNIAGIVYHSDDGNVEHNPPRALIKDLDTLPLPDRAAINLRAYVDAWRTRHGQGSISVICARGCPYHCDWCSHAVYGETHRRRSPEGVVAEVEQLIEEYAPDQLWYADDVFTIHHEWLFRYASLLKSRGIKIPFECITRADRVNARVAHTLKEMGCARVWIGSESGSQRILDGMRRGVTVEQVQWATQELQRHGIQVGMFIMLGYEGEGWPDLVATNEHLRKSRPNAFLSTVAYPIKGTAYYDRVKPRLVIRAPWRNRSDRNLSVRGRHSRRFYEYAQRWMAGGFNWRWHRTSPRRNLIPLMKAAVNVGWGRIGMLVSGREREQ